MAPSTSRMLSTRAASRPATSKSRPKTSATSTCFSSVDNDIICAVSESRGVSPSIGLAFVNLSTCEVVLCQFTDTQTFARACHKIKVFNPNEILYASTATDSKLIAILQENLEVDKYGISMTQLDRGYWSENIGQGYISNLALPDDLEALRLSLTGNYFAVCCFAATLRFIETDRNRTFATNSVRIKFESSEGAVMIDPSTIANLELVQNQQNSRSKDCLYGLLNHTQTRMGARLLKNNILQPSTDRTKIERRWEVVKELSENEKIFFAARESLKGFVDTDSVLAALVVLSIQPEVQYMEQAFNHILRLRTFVNSIQSVWQALEDTNSAELQKIKELCNNKNYAEIQELLVHALSTDVTYSQSPIDLRNQRVYAINAGTDNFLDVARQSYSELLGDANTLIQDLQGELDLRLELKSDSVRNFYIKIRTSDLEPLQSLPEVFINVCHKSKSKNKYIECQTLALVKINQKINTKYDQIIELSNSTIQRLTETVRSKLAPLYKISESIALLDLLASFAYLVIDSPVNYVHPEICSGIIAIKSGRHPIREKIQHASTSQRYVANDVYATREHKRFQIITGCNMSGKSTYIRSIALMTIMAQIGCFIPAEQASFPIVHQVFARVATDDCLEANVSTFAAEMREMAFILRNIEPESLVIIDELGRGTSTTDGLAITIAISEALIQSKAFVWFVTHFRDLPKILAEKVGVYNSHMSVDMEDDFSRMKMRYRVSQGYEEQRFYGLALAQLVDLPDEILSTAVQVSKALHAKNDAKRSNTKMLLLARKRKLAVHVKETLIQARDGPLVGTELLDELKALQAEFAVRMLAIDTELDEVEKSQAPEQARLWGFHGHYAEHSQTTLSISSRDSESSGSMTSFNTKQTDEVWTSSPIFQNGKCEGSDAVETDAVDMIPSVLLQNKRDIDAEFRRSPTRERE